MIETMRRIAFALLMVGATAGSAAARDVVFSDANRSIGFMVVEIAVSHDFFKDEGINLSVVDFKGGGPAIQAAVGGGADACLCTGDHVLYLASHGIAARILVSLVQFYGYGLVARADSPYTDLKSLKGHRVGITSAGSSTDNMIRYAIKQLGLDADTDFELLGVGVSGAMEPAIETGSVAAGMLTSPDFQAFVHTPGKYRVIDDFTTVPYPMFAVVVMDSWLKKNPDAARGIAKAVARALAFVKATPDAMRDYIKKTYPEFDDGLVAQLVQESLRVLSPDGRVMPETWQSANDILVSFDPTLKPVPFADATAPEYLPSASPGH